MNRWDVEEQDHERTPKLMDTHTTLQLNSETDSDPEVDIISIYFGGGRVLMKITQLHPTLCLGSGFFILKKKFPYNINENLCKFLFHTYENSDALISTNK